MAKANKVAALAAAVLGTGNVQALTGETVNFKDAEGAEVSTIVPKDIGDATYQIFKDGETAYPGLLELRRKVRDLEADCGNRLMAIARICIQRCGMNVSQGLNLFKGACHMAEERAKDAKKAEGIEKPNLREMLPSWSGSKSAVITFLEGDATKGIEPGDLFSKLPGKDPKTGKAILTDTDEFQTISAVRKYNASKRAPNAANKASKVLPGLAQCSPARKVLIEAITEQLNYITDDNDGNKKADAVLFACVEALAALTEKGRRHLETQRAISHNVKRDQAASDAKMNQHKTSAVGEDSGDAEPLNADVETRKRGGSRA